MSTSGKLRHSIESLRERQLWAGITWIVHQLFDHAAADQMAAVSPNNQSSAFQLTVAYPHATFDQASSCKKYETKPAADPAMAIPPLAATEPVKIKPINNIEQNPATCQVTALVRSLTLLSMK